MTYPITPILQEIDFDPIVTPYMTEFIPQGSAANANERDNDPNFNRLMKFRRIVMWQLVGQIAEDLGLSRGFEARESADVYLITIRAESFDTARSIFNKVRDKLINYPRLANDPTYFPYNKYTFTDLAPVRFKTMYLYEFRVEAWKSGKERISQ